MNLDKLFAWIVGVVIAFAVTGQLDVLQSWVWRAQAKVIYESRSSNWGSPRFFNVESAKTSGVSRANAQPDRECFLRYRGCFYVNTRGSTKVVSLTFTRSDLLSAHQNCLYLLKVSKTDFVVKRN